MATPKGLAARARVVVELIDGIKIHIEVRDNSKFVQFYSVYTLCSERSEAKAGGEHLTRDNLPGIRAVV
jgi:hypothetical protein